MKKCSEIMELIGLYIDNELDADLRAEFDEHIKVCENCKNEYTEQLEIVKLCNSIEEEELPEVFKEQLHEKLLKEKQRKNPLFFIKRRNVRIISSIAAVILIAFIARDFIMRDNYESGIKSESAKSFFSPSTKGADTNDLSLRATTEADNMSGDVSIASGYDFGNELEEIYGALEISEGTSEEKEFDEGTVSIGGIPEDVGNDEQEYLIRENMSKDLRGEYNPLMQIENITASEQDVVSVYMNMKVEDIKKVIDIANNYSIKLDSYIYNDAKAKNLYENYSFSLNVEKHNYNLFIEELKSLFEDIDISKVDGKILINLE
ncbi:UNVERIFIED_CONTAM: putative zinc finger protein [Acetivibrio alkalicellulosi]